MARLLSVNVGLPKEIAWRGRTVRTGIWKAAVPGRRLVRRINIDGDGQGDLIGHGGEQRAVLVYQMSSYAYWEAQLHRSDFVFGQFGENFTVEGLPDDEVCIGDRYRIGSALFEVTQPRVTCYRVGIRMDEPRMAALLVSSRRPGFYLRVLREGYVEAGDEIVKVVSGPERMSVVEVDALLYLPGHASAPIERALRIPALSPGWRASFDALLARGPQDLAAGGNPGLVASPGPSAAWPGFRPLRVTKRTRESRDIVSFVLEAAGAMPLAPALPGQFIVLRLDVPGQRAKLLRSYSLSGPPHTHHYRISVKRETHGVAGAYLHDRVGAGDLLEASAPRGGFLLHPGDAPAVLLSAGVGATPLLAMLHALAVERSHRSVWWIHGARNREQHAFREESRRLLGSLAHGHWHVRYSRPGPSDRPEEDYSAAGRVTMATLEALDVPREAEFYLCGPAGFLRDLTSGLRAWGVPAGEIRSEMFGAQDARTPGVVHPQVHRPHSLDPDAGAGPLVSFARSGVSAAWSDAYGSLLELAEACDVPVRWACRTGVCHSCESGLVSGEVTYQPRPLEPPAAGDVLICCARPQGDVVLDL